jgi:hypothetical protein
MSVLDTFYLLFKSDAPQAAKEIGNLEKQIDSLKAKGKARSEQENKDLKESTKNLKELRQEQRESGRETEKLTDGLARAAAAYLSFQTLKAGVLNTAKFNSDLKILSDATGQNADSMLAYSSAIKAAGGDQQQFLGFVQQLNQQAAEAGIKMRPFEEVMRDINRQMQSLSKQDQTFWLSQYGITDPASINFMTQSIEKFDEAIEKHQQLTKQSEKTREESRKFEEQNAKTASAVSSAWSKANETILPILTELSKRFETFFTRMADPEVTFGDMLKIGGRNIIQATGGEVGTQWMTNKEKKALNGGDRSAPMVDGDGMSFWKSKGYTHDQAAAIEANIQAESAGKAEARGDGGRAHGILQWHPPRRAEILKATGIDVSTANAMQQREALAWEMKNVKRSGWSDEKFRAMGDAEGAAYMSDKFVSPADRMGEIMKRSKMAINMAGNMPPPGATVGGSKSMNVQIGDVTVNTQATDSSGIAKDFASDLQSQFETTGMNFDDGVAY